MGSLLGVVDTERGEVRRGGAELAGFGAEQQGGVRGGVGGDEQRLDLGLAQRLDDVLDAVDRALALAALLRVVLEQVERLLRDVQGHGVGDPLAHERLAAVAAAAAGDHDELVLQVRAAGARDEHDLALVAGGDDELGADLLGERDDRADDLAGVGRPSRSRRGAGSAARPAAHRHLADVGGVALHGHLVAARGPLSYVRRDVGAGPVGEHDDVRHLGGDVVDERQQVGERRHVDDRPRGARCPATRRAGRWRRRPSPRRAGRRPRRARPRAAATASRVRSSTPFSASSLEHALPGQVVLVGRLLDRALALDEHGHERALGGRTSVRSAGPRSSSVGARSAGAGRVSRRPTPTGTGDLRPVAAA